MSRSDPEEDQDAIEKHISKFKLILVKMRNHLKLLSRLTHLLGANRMKHPPPAVQTVAAFSRGLFHPDPSSRVSAEHS